MMIMRVTIYCDRINTSCRGTALMGLGDMPCPVCQRKMYRDWRPSASADKNVEITGVSTYHI